MPSQFDSLLSNDYWKFFTDVSAWKKNDHMIFDNQQSPGYFRGCSQALWWMLKTLDRPVNLDYIIALRNLAYHKEGKARRGLALNNVSSGIGPDTFTKDGLEELMAEARKPDTPAFILTISDETSNNGFSHSKLLWEEHPQLFDRLKTDIEDKKTVRLFRNTSSVKKTDNEISEEYTSHCEQQSLEEIQDIGNAYLSSYYQEIAAATSSDEKLLAIVKLIQSLHQFHFFNDGNGRTFCFFLLNRLLHDNELPLTIIEDPGWFTGWSRQELVEQVKIGQQRFQNISHPMDIPLTEIIAQKIELTEPEKNQLWLSPNQRDNYMREFCNAPREKRLTVLEKMPFHERIYFLDRLNQQNIRNEQVKNDIGIYLEQLRFLQRAGFDDNNDLCKALMQTDAVEQAQQLLTQLNFSDFSTHPGWREIATDMINKKVKDASIILTNVIITAEKLKKQPWFDMQRYTDMLLASSPQYETFTLPNAFSPKIHYLSKQSVELLKKYAYQNPRLIEKFLFIAENLTRAEMDHARHIRVSSDQRKLPNNIYLSINLETRKIQCQISDDQLNLHPLDPEDMLLQKISPEKLKKIKCLIEKEMHPKNSDEMMRLRLKNTDSYRTKIEKIDPKFFDTLREFAEKAVPNERLIKSQTEAHLDCQQLLSHPETSTYHRSIYKQVLHGMRHHFFKKEACNRSNDQSLQRQYPD